MPNMSLGEFRVWLNNCCQDATDRGLETEDMVQGLLDKARQVNVRDINLQLAIAYMDKAKEILQDNILKEAPIPEIEERKVKSKCQT